jgi:magnesium transporter
MIGKSIQPEIEGLIRARDFATLREVVDDLLVPDFAELIADIEPQDRAVVFRLLPKQRATEVFEYLDHDSQRELIEAMAKEDVSAILNDMRPDDRTAFLGELPAPVARDLIARLSPEERRVAQALLGYPEESIGRLMTLDYVAVREEWTIEQVLASIREHGKDSETLNMIYVVDEAGKLIDEIRIREILLAQPQTKVRDLEDSKFIALSATDDRETAVHVFDRYDRVAFPVTDSEGILVGIVTVDDVLGVAQAESTEDQQKFGGMERLDAPYMDTAFFRMVKKRAGWLVILFVGEMLTATAMGFFEKEIARAVVLALFVPLIISSGGNSGSQASTLVIRAMALGEISLADWWRVMRREVMSGLTLGAILGSIGFLRIAVWSAVSPIYGEHWILVGMTVAVSLVGVVMWGTLSGSMLPFLLKKLGADPATSSAPFVATLVDVTGLIIYFTTAMAIMSGKML